MVKIFVITYSIDILSEICLILGNKKQYILTKMNWLKYIAEVISMFKSLFEEIF